MVTGGRVGAHALTVETESVVTRFRLVVADLDGTLLDPLGRISPRTHTTAAKLRERGIPLVLATSRRLASTAVIAEVLTLDGPLILYDGALIRHYPTGRQVFVDPLASEIAQAAAEIVVAHGLRPIVQHADSTGEWLLTGPGGDDEYDANYLALFGSQVTNLPLETLCRGRPDPLRLVVFGPMERLRVAAGSVAELACGWQLLPTGNYGTSELSVFSRTASKATAVAWLAQQHGISLDHVFAIGDGINDVSLLASVGYGVAMGNGGEHARSVASAVAPPNDADGAACAIEEYVLNIWESG